MVFEMVSHLDLIIAYINGDLTVEIYKKFYEDLKN